MSEPLDRYTHREAATLLGIVLSTSVMSDKHVEECIVAATPMIDHLASLNATIAPLRAAPPSDPAAPLECPHGALWDGRIWTRVRPTPAAPLREALDGVMAKVRLDLLSEDTSRTYSAAEVALIVRRAVESVSLALATPAPKEADHG